MSADPRRLKLVDLCRLLNSTPLGEVIQEHQLKNHRNRAGLRIGDSRRIDLVKYVAWLVAERHKPKAAKAAQVVDDSALVANAQGAAALAAWSNKAQRSILTTKMQDAIAALVTSNTYAEAAKVAGVSESSIYRWLAQADFQAAYQQARRLLVDSAVGRIQAAVGRAVDEIVKIASTGRRDADRLRAATAILDHAYRGLEAAEMLHGTTHAAATKDFATRDVVQMLAARLHQIDGSELPAGEKARLTTALSDSLLRAFSIDVLDKRLEALQAVLIGRKEKKERKSA